MKISFHGAARTVTGSKHLITLDDGRKILLDCGMFQGLGKDTDPLNRNLGFDANSIDAVILSHAHIDHSGLLPVLVRDGYLKPIFCTSATKDLASILLEDSAKIQKSDVKYANKRRIHEGLPLYEPMYEERDALATGALFEERNYDEWFQVIPGVECMFTDAGHIIGSACVNLKIKEKGREEIRLLFSGDIGRYNDAILRPPEPCPQADFVIMESTYGDRVHDHAITPYDTLYDAIMHTCIQKGGKLIIPAFSVGRTQEILYALNQLELENRLPNVDYFVDSPLSKAATAIVKSHPENFNEKLQNILKIDSDPFDFKKLKFIRTVDESKMLNYHEKPCVIISASGMAEAGRIKHHIMNNISNSRNTILFSGYCEPMSLGGRLKRKPKDVKIFGLTFEVHAEIAEVSSMSAHGDYNDMLHWLSAQNPEQVQTVFLVHGEFEVQQSLASRIRNKGYKQVNIPEIHEEFEI